MFFSKKTIFVSVIFLFVFLFAVPLSAYAMVTCCTCGVRTEVRDPETGHTSTELRFSGFACSQGEVECNTVCAEGRTTTTRTGEWQALGGEERTAQGEVATCCGCGAYYRCRSTNQTCDTICGDLGGYTGNWIRETSEGIEGTKKEGEEKEEETPVQIEKPRIEIPIPGFIGFSEVKVEGEYISLPWIAEYISAIFNWLIMIAGGIATVMLMLGGFLYLTAAGNQGQVGKAKKMITNALIGLLLAVGSYLILYTIDPSLVEFKSVKLKIIERKDVGFEISPLSDEEINRESSGSGEGARPTSVSRAPEGEVAHYLQANPNTRIGGGPWANRCCSGVQKPSGGNCGQPMTSGFAGNGCCLTSMAMILDYLAGPERQITPNTILDTENPANSCSVSHPGLSRLLSGIRRENITDLERAKTLLREGHPLYFNCKPCVGFNASNQPARGSAGHCVVLTGYDGSRYTVNDPATHTDCGVSFITNEQMEAMVNRTITREMCEQWIDFNGCHGRDTNRQTLIRNKCGNPQSPAIVLYTR